MSDLGVGVLTWRSHATLRQTLDSHQAAQMMRLTGEQVVFVQGRDDDQQSVSIAQDFDYRIEGSARNLGILGGFEALIHSMRSPLILLNENDFQISEPPEIVEGELTAAQNIFHNDQADIVWLRSRTRPGLPFTVREKALRFFPDSRAPAIARAHAAALRMARRGKAKRMAARFIRFDPQAHLRFPDLITNLGDGWLASSSQWLPWTNNPCIVRRTLLLRLLDQAKQEKTTRGANGFKNFEIEMNTPWWRSQKFRIAQGRGVFTHNRLGDRGYV